MTELLLFGGVFSFLYAGRRAHRVIAVTGFVVGFLPAGNMRPTYQLYDIWKITTQVWDYSVEPIACNVIQSLIYEAAKRGHTVAITTGKNLTIRDNVAYAFCQVVVKSNKVSNKVPTFYRQVAFRKRMLPLGGFDAIIMRDNPPLDPTVLNFLDSVKEGTFIMNDIDGLRIANNKIYTASFGDDAKKFIPSTHVSRNRDYLERVLEESDSGKKRLCFLFPCG